MGEVGGETEGLSIGRLSERNEYVLAAQATSLEL